MPPVQRQLVYSAHAVAVVNPTSTDTIEQVLMNIVLMNMYYYYDTNSLRGQDLKNTTIPNSYSHKSQVRYTLELSLTPQSLHPSKIGALQTVKIHFTCCI